MGATRTALRKLLVLPYALLSRLVNIPPTCLASSTAAPIRRLFSTDEGLTRADDTTGAVDVNRQGWFVSRRFRNRAPATILFSDVFDPFFLMRSLSQVMNMMDMFIDEPFFNRNWVVKEDDDVLRLRIDMPGFGVGR